VTLANVCRWTARVLAVASALFVLAFAWGEPSSARPLTTREIMLLGLMILALLGNLAAWRWELTGATIALLSTLAFTGIELARHGALPGPWLLGVTAAPAVFYVASWLLRKRTAT
jgi:membrane-bound acyltransferase YfiQ involved in biofilm formation